MYSSLRHIRNSATKKQLSKIFDHEKSKELDQQESVTSLTTDEQEMGVKTSQRRLFFQFFLLYCVCTIFCVNVALLMWVLTGKVNDEHHDETFVKAN